MGIEQFIDNEVKANDVVLFMKGTPQFPMCGFSGLFQLADHSAALCEGRIRRRLRHHPRDVPGR
jgi:monothiol glutaredoxin